MKLITFLSLFAMLLGLAGGVPQIVRMLSARSAAGQSPSGWAMGMACNMAMAYVNLVGLHATLLAASNLLSMTLCGVAITLIVRLEDRRPPAASVVVHELPTAEFEALREAVLSAEARRQPVPAAA